MKIPYQAIALFAGCLSVHSPMSAEQLIVIETDNNALVYNVADNNRLYQRYLGKKLHNSADYKQIPDGPEAYLTHGMEDYYEPALHINHADGNSSTLLQYVKHDTTTLSDGAFQTVITLTDPEYNDEVKLYYTVYPEHDIIKTHTEITNRGNKPVEIEKYASSLLHFNGGDYYLTQYNGDWASEVNASETKLEYGKKQLDTKLGTRADMFCSPFFQLGLGTPASETQGDLLVGTLSWTGNFRFTFEVDHKGELRVISGINPYFSTRTLSKGETFTTPEFIFTLSDAGRGKASRNFHDWARDHQVYKGNDSRLTLLNNWEATYFDFDEEKLLRLIGEARELGVDMFLLDDGWFANKYPRHSDTQGLGDWIETSHKLPNGIGALTKAARENGIKFGLWIEPEMVNPKSELYEKHKNWVITLPNRDEYYFRNQLVLDLSNPDVQDYVFGIVDNLMTKYPDIAFFKWDCNSPITNIYSNYEKEQTDLYVDYVKGLYNVLERIQAKYPDLMMMMCSGGGGRSDYEGLKYFTEFWPSDNTDPVERLYIQWGFSQVFPAKTLSAHVTTWNRSAPVKFRTNVAMMGKLGFDIKLSDMSKDEVEYCKRAIKNYNALKSIILDGDQYRLVSPYEGQHASTMYVGKEDGNSVLFTFDIYPRYKQSIFKSEANVRLAGLNPDVRYRVTEIDRADGNDRVIGEYSGDYLMTIGLPLFTLKRLNSRVFTINKMN
ncbi:MAG: alpha-galactosidase [Muribaculaceae bacterium]|nr:alpha-galactosidase [Muribaculaceae bacterium]